MPPASGVTRITTIFATTALGLLGTPGSGFAAPPPVQFAPAVHYATGASGAGGWSETSLVTADFDNDGDSDVVGADYFSGGAPILQRNLGNGAFQSPGTRLPAATEGVGTLATGDVNGDGNADLLLSNTNNILVYLGNGDATFTAGQTYPISQGGQEDIAVLDANSDGNADAAVVTRRGFQMMLGRGDGTFTLPAETQVPGIFPAGIDDARFNGDAHPDILLIDGGGQVIPMLGTGTGGFTQGSPGYAGFILGTGLAADFNGDGIDDAVALPEFNSGVRNAVVFISNGQGGFVNPMGTYYDGGCAPVSGEIADLNGDRKADVIASDTVCGQQVILLGNGDGTFTQGGKFAMSSSVQTPVVADFDGDRRTDIAAVGTKNNAGVLSVLRNIT